MILPREFRRTGIEQIDWPLMGFGATVFVVVVAMLAFFASLPETEATEEDIEALQARVATLVLKQDFKEPPPPAEKPKAEAKVAEAPTTDEAPPPVETRQRQRGGDAAAGGGDAGGGTVDRAAARAAARAARGAQREALAQQIAAQGVWSQLAVAGGTGSGPAIASSGLGGGPADLESTIGQVGGVKRGGTSTLGAGGGAGSGGGGSVLGPGGGRSTRGGTGGGRDVGMLLGGGGLGGGGATSLGGSGPGGSVELSTPEVAGDTEARSSAERSDEAIQGVVRQNIGPIKFCYQRELKLNPQLQGSIKVKFTIEADGRVSDVSIVNDTVGSASLTRCVQGRIRAWRFKPVAKGTSIVSYTFPFSPG